ncbi:MAG: sugar kinase [Verrucomicrobia bacterium]|nr:sugar kinase [Verrucomicrobiota bacterium]
MSLNVVTFGEAMAMFVADEAGDLSKVSRFTLRPAGAELNVAIGLARLGFKIGWVSRVGSDSFGRFILEVLDREGVDRRAVTIDGRYPTGFQLKSTGFGKKDPIVEYYRKGSAASHLSVEDFDPDYFLSAEHLHITGIAPALTPTTWELALHVMEQMRKNGKTISFDPNLRPVLWPSKEIMAERINLLASKADWVLPGIEEGRILTGLQHLDEITDFYLSAGAKLVIVKVGEEGAYFQTAGLKPKRVPTEHVANVVDTVGAGDGFAVGVISGLLESLSIEDAVARGNRIAGLVIQQIGDSEGLPTREQLLGHAATIPRPPAPFASESPP